MNRQEIETELQLGLPNAFEKYDIVTKETIIKYLKHLDPIEKQAYTIGINHLGSSFNVVKSNGYIEWTKNNK
jgi:hypothetical protein